MFALVKTFRFEAAHKLENHNGKCARLHGHSWNGELVVRAQAKVPFDKSPKEGMVVDYSDLKAILNPIIDQYLDHHYLNETLMCHAPTSEFVAQWLHGQVKPKIENLSQHYGHQIWLHHITIMETCTSECHYWEDHSLAFYSRNGIDAKPNLEEILHVGLDPDNEEIPS